MNALSKKLKQKQRSRNSKIYSSFLDELIYNEQDYLKGGKRNEKKYDRGKLFKTDITICDSALIRKSIPTNV